MYAETLKLAYGDHYVMVSRRSELSTGLLEAVVKCSECGSSMAAKFSQFEMTLNPTLAEEFVQNTIEMFRKKFPESCNLAKVLRIHES